MINLFADNKAVGPHLLKAMTCIEALGAVVLRPDSDPKVWRSILVHPGHDSGE